MLKIISASVLLFYVSDIFAESDISRFNRSIREFTYPDYKLKDTDLSLQVNFDRRLNSVDQSTFDLGDKNINTKNSNNEFSGVFTLQNYYTKIKPNFSFEYKDRYAINGNIKESCRSTDDTLTSYYNKKSERRIDAAGIIENEFSFNKHFCRNPMKNLPFAGVSLRHTLKGEYNRLDNYALTNLEYASNNDRQESIVDNINIIPKIGLNNRKPVNHVFKAFNLESKLRKTGVLQGCLSDGTFKKLVTLIGAETKYRQSYEYFTKFMMQDIDSLLRNDPAIDTSKINAFVLFKAHEALTFNSPEFFCGIEVYATNYINVRYSYMKEFVNNNSSTYNDFYLEEGPVEFILNFTHPLYSKLYITTEWTIDPFGASDNQFRLRYVNVKYLFGFYYLLSDRVFVNASLSNKPRAGQYSNDFALSLNIFTKIYVDEKLSIYLSLNRNYDRKSERNLLETNNYSSGNIGVTYDF